MRVSLTTIVALGLATILGAVVGQAVSSGGAPAVTARRTHASFAATNRLPRAWTPARQQSRAKQLSRTDLRDELDAALTRNRTQDGADDEKDPSAPVAPPTADQLAAADDAGTLVDDAVDRGTWKVQDGDELLSLASKMSADDHYKLMLRVGAAINRGDLTPDRDAVF